ncbi:c-type cytochrome [Aquabacterium parvum]|uniref:c-type cytochrome n=1 Tax=Aquabacterium parvum TaxID=70584 RepID=UPI000718F102|nr:c-type cytochrome [Aquabacterium parvum]MBU0915382.1 c-type cytochrome [Gammaproteobacteria bacterium]
MPLSRLSRLIARVSLVAALGALAACQGSAPTPPTDADVLAAEALRPARPELAATYERSCMACHGVRSAAPLTGHAESWRPRLAQGMDTLLKHTREGLRGMPAMGLCPDCSEQDFSELITFMSTPR